MYCVVDKTNSGWVGTCMIQDGFMKAEQDTKEKAVGWVINCAKVMNHVDITIEDIFINPYVDDTQDSLIERYDHFQQARAKTTDMLIDALDRVNIVNLRLRIALKEIARHRHASECPAVEGGSSACRCAIQIAKDALDNIKD